jgi:hypothetical protein
MEVLDIMRKLRIPSSDITLSTAYGKPLTVHEAILDPGGGHLVQHGHTVPPHYHQPHLAAPDPPELPANVTKEDIPMLSTLNISPMLSSPHVTVPFKWKAAMKKQLAWDMELGI